MDSTEVLTDGESRPKRRRRILDNEENSQDAATQALGINEISTQNLETPIDSMTRALGISLITDHLFQYLNFDDLKNSALVSLSWNTVFGSLLDKWTVFVVTFDFMRGRSKFTVKEKIGLDYKISVLLSLKKLEAKLNSVSHKVLKIIVSADHPLPQVFTDLIRTLSPWIVHASCHMTYYSHIMSFIPLLSHVRSMIIGDVRFDKPSDPLPEDSLLHLTSLCLDESYLTTTSNILFNFFLAAPNLKRFVNFPLNAVQTIKRIPEVQSQISSLYCSHQLTLDPHEFKRLALLSKFCPTIKLEHIIINLTSAFESSLLGKTCQIYSDLLLSSKESLNRLTISPLPEGKQNVNFPIFTNLNTIQFHFPSSLDNGSTNNKNNIGIFPKDFTFNHHFPIVSKVKFVFEYENLKVEHVKTCFGQDNTMCVCPLVRHLDIEILTMEKLVGEQVMSSLAPIFPNLDTLVLKIDKCDLKILSTIWGLWPNLEQLSIEIWISESSSSQDFYMDELFTGIPEITCSPLREHLKIGPPHPNSIGELRKGPSICTMTNLQGLRIIFNENLMDRYPTLKCPFSPVTFFYGFNLLPQLQVVFCIEKYYMNREKLKKILQPILPYVPIIPDYWSY